MEKCTRMKRQLCMSKNWTYSWFWKSSKTRQQSHRLESFATKTDIPVNGSMVKNHISSKTGLGFHAIRKTAFSLSFQACQVRPLDRLEELVDEGHYFHFLFHNCMGQSKFSEVNVHFVEKCGRTRFLSNLNGSHRSIIHINVFVCIFVFF